MNHSVTTVAKLSRRKIWGDNFFSRLSADWLSLPLIYSYMDETSVHNSIVILRRVSKTRCQSKVLIVSTIVSSVVSVTIVIVRIKKFVLFLLLRWRRFWSGVNCLNVIVKGVAGLGKKERSNDKTLVSSLVHEVERFPKVKNIAIFRGKKSCRPKYNLLTLKPS